MAIDVAACCDSVHGTDGTPGSDRYRRVIGVSWVKRLEAINCIASYGAGDGASSDTLSFVAQLQRDLPKYIAAASGFTCNHGDVEEFTVAVLDWW